MARKRVLVAGGTGFLGAALARGLVAQGHDVRVTLHNRDLPSDLFELVSTMVCDLRFPGQAERACEGVDAVFMCAAVTSGAKDIVERPLKHVTDNIIMNACMLRAAWEAGVRDFLFVSSGAAYPEFGGDALSESDFWVHGELHPAYRWVGTMKRQAEELCLLYAEMGMRMTIIRPSNVYGPGDNFDPDTSHVTAAMVRKFAEAGDGGTVEVWGDGLDERDLIYVDDFARAALLAWAWTDGYQAINVASGATVSVEDILLVLEEATGCQVGRIYQGDKPHTIRSRSFNVGRLHSLGFEPRVLLGEGLKQTLGWYEMQRGIKA